MAESNELFGKNFVDSTVVQQEAQLRAIDDVEMANRQRPAKHGNTVPEPDAYLKGPFWVIFKSMTLHGYYTSEIGFKQELKLEIIPGAHHGCTPLGSGIGS